MKQSNENGLETNVVEELKELEANKTVTGKVAALEQGEQQPNITEEKDEDLEALENLKQTETVERLSVEKRLQALQQVQTQFNFNGENKYYFKDYKDQLAFRDRGDRLTTATNDSRSAKAMAVMAEAKGWESIKVSGHPDFKREVWLEAMSRGISVKGYEPKEYDLKLLESRLDKLQKNIIEPAINSEHSSKETSREVDSEYQNKDKISGKILNFGVADYLFDPENTKEPKDKNFFIELETKQGDNRMVWGKDLERVIETGKYKVNDEITLEKGLVKNNGDKTLPRTQWIATLEKKAVIKEVADAVIDQKIKNPVHAQAIRQELDKQLTERKNLPAVKVFDKAAQPRVKQGQQITVDLERTR